MLSCAIHEACIMIILAFVTLSDALRLEAPAPCHCELQDIEFCSECCSAN